MGPDDVVSEAIPACNDGFEHCRELGSRERKVGKWTGVVVRVEMENLVGGNGVVRRSGSPTVTGKQDSARPSTPSIHTYCVH